jgi:hypothetical protein
MHCQFQFFKEKRMNCEFFWFLDIFCMKFLDVVEKNSEILDSKIFLII